MNSIQSTVSFEHEIPGADILLLISAPNESHFEPNLFLLSRVQGADMSIPTFLSKNWVRPDLILVQKIPGVRVRSPRLFEHNFLKAVGRTEKGGNCKVL